MAKSPSSRKRAGTGDPARRPRAALAVALIAAAAFVAFVPVLRAGFTNWDDPEYVVENPAVQHLSWAGVQDFFSSYHLSSYVPLTMLSYAMDAQVWGMRPGGFHATSLLLHVLNAVLAAGLAFVLLRDRIAAFVAGLLFGVHPLRVETVAWIADRKDVLATAFFLAAAIVYVQYLRERTRGRYAVALALFVASLLSKGMGVSLPFVLLLCAWYLDGRVDRRNLRELVPFAAIAVVFAWLAYAGQQGSGAIGKQVGLPGYAPVLVAARGLLFYIVKSVVPTGLSAIYPYPAPGSGWPASFWLAPFGVAVLAALLFAARRWQPLVLGAGFFVLTVLPVLQFIPLGFAVAADRYSYLPSFGLCLVAGAAAALVLRRRPATWLAVAAVLILSGVLTWNRTLVWRDSLTLWTDALEHYPDAHMAHMLRARAWLDLGNQDQARADYRRVTELPAGSADEFNNRGVAWLRAEEYRRAADDFRQALSIAPRHPMALLNLGDALVGAGDDRGALDAFTRALARRAGDPDLRLRRALVRARANDWDGALSDLDAALEADPDLVAARVNRGVALARRGDLDRALLDLDRAVALEPGNVEAWYNRGLVRSARREFDQAVADFSRALDVDPAHADARARRAEVYLRLGDRERARADVRALLDNGRDVSPALRAAVAD